MSSFGGWKDASSSMINKVMKSIRAIIGDAEIEKNENDHTTIKGDGWIANVSFEYEKSGIVSKKDRVKSVSVVVKKESGKSFSIEFKNMVENLPSMVSSFIARSLNSRGVSESNDEKKGYVIYKNGDGGISEDGSPSKESKKMKIFEKMNDAVKYKKDNGLNDYNIYNVNDKIMEMNESILILNEVAPPDPKIEDWINKMKPEFEERYGDGYKPLLYGRAWKMYNRKPKKKK
jgi:hypothetical protein